jgi:hypothetical protein
MPRKQKTPNATQLLDDLRQTMSDGVHHSLDFVDKLVKKRDELTTHQLATETVDYVFKGGELTLNAYRNAYNLLFPRRGGR